MILSAESEYRSIIRQVFERVLPRCGDGVDDDTSIFTTGADSLQVVGLAMSLSRLLWRGKGIV
jgi:acyl carrier protein